MTKIFFMCASVAIIFVIFFVSRWEVGKNPYSFEELKVKINIEFVIGEIMNMEREDFSSRRLTSVLSRTDLKGLYIHSSEFKTKFIDKIRGYNRYEIFVFKDGNPHFKVNIIIKDDSVVVLDARLVIQSEGEG